MRGAVELCAAVAVGHGEGVGPRGVEAEGGIGYHIYGQGRMGRSREDCAEGSVSCEAIQGIHAD